MKGKAFFISALVFGGLGIIMLVLTLISYFCGDELISGAIAQMLGLSTESFNDATMAQISIVLFIPAFIFGYRALSDNDEADEEQADAPAAVQTAAETEQV